MRHDTEVTRARRLCLVLGDQLDADAPLLGDLDPARDVVVMIETAAEARHVWSHRHRIALCLAAMRHFADALVAAGFAVHYVELADDCPDLAAGLAAAIARYRPDEVVLTEAGEWRVEAALRQACSDHGVGLRLLPDTHFHITREEFATFAAGRKRLRMEDFYRAQRRRFGVLMDGDQPAGGRWNFDADNREPLPRDGPGTLPRPPAFPPDATTAEVLAEVAERFANHPGELDGFDWPVTADDAALALERFIDDRLAGFGRHQDAMWRGEPFLWHSLLSPALNLKLLDPRRAIAAAEQAWRDGRAPLAAVEGFIRQVLGWREYMRGVYWLHMPGYAGLNHFGHRRDLPAWFWTGDTDMACLHHAIADTLRHGYAHHIQRLMVIGNFAVLAELEPRQVCDWFLAVYVDAIEWVELPNTAGMALFADGGIVGSKPYVASGRYIQRMGNYCGECRYRVDRRSGDDACPYNRLYWRFLARHRDTLGDNPRMRQVLANLDRWSADEVAAIMDSAAAFLATLTRDAR